MFGSLRSHGARLSLALQTNSRLSQGKRDTFVGYGIDKCLQGYAPGMYECLLDERDNI